MAEATRQPNEEEQRALDEVMEAPKELVYINDGKKKKAYKVGWLHPGTRRKITHIMLDDNPANDDTLICKLAACIILNGFWSIKLFYWLVWRYFFYIKQYGEEQLKPIIEVGKKKVPQVAYYETTILAIGMMDTMKTMKKKEVERFRQELNGAQPTH